MLLARVTVSGKPMIPEASLTLTVVKGSNSTFWSATVPREFPWAAKVCSKFGFVLPGAMAFRALIPTRTRASLTGPPLAVKTCTRIRNIWPGVGNSWNGTIGTEIPETCVKNRYLYYKYRCRCSNTDIDIAIYLHISTYIYIYIYICEYKWTQWIDTSRPWQPNFIDFPPTTTESGGGSKMAYWLAAVSAEISGVIVSSMSSREYAAIPVHWKTSVRAQPGGWPTIGTLPSQRLKKLQKWLFIEGFHSKSHSSSIFSTFYSGFYSFAASSSAGGKWF